MYEKKYIDYPVDKFTYTGVNSHFFTLSKKQFRIHTKDGSLLDDNFLSIVKDFKVIELRINKYLILFKEEYNGRSIYTYGVYDSGNKVYHKLGELEGMVSVSDFINNDNEVILLYVSRSLKNTIRYNTFNLDGMAT